MVLGAVTNNKIIVIVGPTSSGKTGLAVKLAMNIGGEIISADSRQVYKHMDIGTGKDLREYRIRIPDSGSRILNKFKFQISKINSKKYINIPHHLIDVAHPNTPFDLARWLKKARKSLAEIQKRRRVPIVCGGTGLWTQALVDGYHLSEAGQDKVLRAQLEKKTLAELLIQLKRLDKEKWAGLNNSEKNNKRRLIRYIEIAKSPPGRGINGEASLSDKNKYIVLGIARTREEINKRIYKRLIDRLEKEDMIGEVKRLHEKHRVSWKRLAEFGLEYKNIALYLQKKLTYEEMIESLNLAIRQFAKRQMSWYRRWERQGQRIRWVENIDEAKKALE
jgi:tRNA dimethylallyltransferase